MAEYASAVLAKEPLRLAALYAPDARIFDAWDAWSFEDRNSWSRNLQGWLGSLGNESVKVQFDDVRFAQQAKMGFLSAVVSYNAVDATGRTLRSMQNRLSWVLINDTGRWIIAHEHSSAPISSESQKGLLRRN
jgi:ketosteroid isomerase-like protein